MIKDLLKRSSLLRELNGYVKSRQTIAKYRDTVRQYHSRSELPASDAWRARSSKLVHSASQADFRIFFAGTDEQQDRSGFLQALSRLGDVRCFYRDDGSWGQNDPAPYTERRKRNTDRLEQLFAENAQDGWIPDVLIAQTWACLIEPACFSRLRDRYDVFVINVAMDDRHQYWGTRVEGAWDGTVPLIPHIDLTLTSAPDAVSWYRKEGGGAIYFPEASDPDIFYPMPALPKIHDVSFVGGRYGIREKIVGALRRAGVRVSAYGSGWEGGRIAAEDVPRLFAQSRIVLGVGTIGHCRDFYSLKLRDFDAPMSGSCYLTSDNPDLRDLYEVGSEIATYSDISDCVEQACRLLGDDARRESMARRGYLRAVADHTWDRRFAQMFETLSDEAALTGTGRS